MRRLHLPVGTNFIGVTYHAVTCPHVVTSFKVTHFSAKVNHGLYFWCIFLMEGLGKEIVRTSRFR
jgi:hypothetical protein